MGTWGIGHWIILLVIVLVIFGTKKLRNIGADLGGAVKGFKEGMKGASDAAEPGSPPQQSAGELRGHTIDAEVKKESGTKA